MDYFIQLGHYYAATNDIGNSVLNKPSNCSSGSFGLDNIRVGAEKRVLQVFSHYQENQVYIRHLDTSTTGSGRIVKDWTKIMCPGDVEYMITDRAKYISRNIGTQTTVYVDHSSSILVFSDRGGLYTEGVSGRTLSVIAESTALSVSRVTNTRLSISNLNQYSTTITVIGYGDLAFVTPET